MNDFRIVVEKISAGIFTQELFNEWYDAETGSRSRFGEDGGVWRNGRVQFWRDVRGATSYKKLSTIKKIFDKLVSSGLYDVVRIVSFTTTSHGTGCRTPEQWMSERYKIFLENKHSMDFQKILERVKS